MKEGREMLSKLPRKALKLLRNVRRTLLPKRIFVVDSRLDTNHRLGFFFDKTKIKVEAVGPRSLKPIMFHGPVFLRGYKKEHVRPVVRIGTLALDVDEITCFYEPWNWHRGLEFLFGPADTRVSCELFRKWKNSIPTTLERAYVFGTGPSLALAINRDWSDGIRIVCNTIVRDPQLWHHIKPHAIVAGDALYHFGQSEFARTFRKDLALRLSESPAVVFIYPAVFDVFLRREMSEFADRLIPIPVGDSIVLHETVAQDFKLPDLGNVLNQLLLPVACSVSKRIGLWGFDGRAPNDTMFWSNSAKHNYVELMHTLHESSPAFFDHLVPKDDPEKYVRSVHGDVLAHCLAQAEKDGFTFEMLHKSWTPTLQKYATAGTTNCISES